MKEAQGLVTRRKVREARQLSETEVALLFARGPALLLSIDARRPGLFLLDPAHVPDAREGPFSQFLRSRFEASVMSVMTMPQAGERLVTMTFKTAWPHGPGKGPELILEVMGRHSNLVAVQEGRILMALKVVPESKSRVRPVVPGSIWSPPPPLEGVPVEAATEGDLPLPEDPEAARRLMAGVRGLSPYSASQALLRASEGGRRGLLDGLKAMLASATGEKGYLYHAGQAAHLSPFEPVLNVDGDRVEPFVPFSAAARAWRGSVPSMEPGKGRDVALLQEGLRRRESEIETALSKLQGEQERCLESGQVRLMAETLLVHTSLVPHGASFALLPSPYDAGVKLNIPLDPALSAHENA
ncbi:MAG: NFACT family protein, partial [bacterium]